MAGGVTKAYIACCAASSREEQMTNSSLTLRSRRRRTSGPRLQHQLSLRAFDRFSDDQQTSEASAADVFNPLKINDRVALSCRHASITRAAALAFVLSMP
jgi:hypothetical protein